MDCIKQIDSILNNNMLKPFNGVVFVSRNGKQDYTKAYGYSDVNKKTLLKTNDQFVIGSISKQITAVIVLQEFEAGHLKLNEPIKKYLPELQELWSDTVTIHHLLTHMHGIFDIHKPTVFTVGTQFNYSYSNLGYDLLRLIVERTSGKSFVDLSEELFLKCKMKNTFHPDSKMYTDLVNGYTEKNDGEWVSDTTNYRIPVAAGAFISTAQDLVVWNECLHGGKLLKKKTYELMVTKKQGAVRNHPVFGITEYGYGITINTQNDLLQLGQTGFADGFVTMNFYFPKNETSVIVLQNVVYEGNDFKKIFQYHIQILKAVREGYCLK